MDAALIICEYCKLTFTSYETFRLHQNYCAFPEQIKRSMEKIQEQMKKPPQEFDSVEKPKHYNSHPSAIECIEITEHMNFCLGNAIKYIWRADLKNGTEDLEKAVWYLKREIERRETFGPAKNEDA